MVRAKEALTFTTDEESVGQDYEHDRLIGLDHEWVSFVGAQ